MALPTNKAFNAVWSEETTNNVVYDDTAYKQGIIYQSQVVSNQLNGVFKDVTMALQFQQSTGGIYDKAKKYNVGAIVSLATNTPQTTQTLITGYGYKMRFFRCKADNNGLGITNTPPLNTNPTALGGIDLYPYTAVTDVNGQYWDEMELVKQEKQTNQWKNLGNVNGTFNLNLGGVNEDYDNFTITLTANTNFGNVTFPAKDKSGVLVITGGATYLKKFFANASYGFTLPLDASNAQNVNNGAMAFFPYSTCKALNKIIFTTIY